jgi:hypothetical protein
MVESVDGDKNMSWNQLNSPTKAVKDEKPTKRTKMTTNIVVAVAAAV